MPLNAQEMEAIADSQGFAKTLLRDIQLISKNHLESLPENMGDADFLSEKNALIEEISQLSETSVWLAMHTESLGEDSSIVSTISDALVSLNDKCTELTTRANLLMKKAEKLSPKKMRTIITHSDSNDPRKASSLPAITESEKEWLNDETIRRVVDRLKKLSDEEPDTKKMALAKELEENWENFDALKDEKKEAVKKIIKQVVNFPGFGNTPDTPYLYLSDGDITREERRVQSAIQEKNLLGMDVMLEEVIGLYTEKLEDRMHNDPDKIGTSIPERDDDDKKVKKPYFWGPPGVGKTVAAKALAKALAQPMVYLSAEKIKKIEDIFGRGGEWQGGAKLGPVAEAMAAYKRTDLFIFIDELDKIPHEVLLQLTNFLGDPANYEDAGLGVTVDLSKCTFFLAGNGISCLDLIEHLRSRLEPTYFPGYDAKTQEAILTNRALQLMNKNDLHKHVHLCMGKDFESDKYVNFDGFSAKDPNVIAYLIENYATEPGVREIERDLKTIIDAARTTHRRTGKNVSIDITFVHEVLKKPDSNVKKIKDLNKEIDEAMKSFNSLSEKMEGLLDSSSDSAETEVKSLIKDLEKQKNIILKKEEEVLKALKIRLRNPKAKRKDIESQIEQHQECIKDIKIRSASLASQIKERFPDIDILSLQESTRTSHASPLKPSTLDAHLSEAPSSKPPEKPLGPTRHGTVLPHSNPSMEMDSSRSPSRGPSIDLPSKLNGPMEFGFSLSKRARKVHGKNKEPSLLVKDGGHFEKFCQKEIEKIDAMHKALADHDTREKIKNINNLKTTGDDSAIAQAFKSSFKGTPFEIYAEQKTPPKHSVGDRVEHKINTAYMYENLGYYHKHGENTFVITRTQANSNPQAIITIARDDATQKTRITAEDFETEDKDLWLMVEYARDHSSSGKFTITDCNDNPTAAMKLFVFGIVAKLDPQLPPETEARIKTYFSETGADPALIEMFRAATTPGKSHKDIMHLFEVWEKSTKEAEVVKQHPAPYSPL